MKKPIFLSLLLVGQLLAGERPNILFIFSDDHSPQAIGAYEGWLKSLNPTPEIDRLAAEGMVFEKSFCTNSICGPSRAVILSGKHSHKNGFMNNGNSFDWNQPIFPKFLREAGYETALFGKSHLKGTPQGFDHWAVLPGQGLYYNPDLITPVGRKMVPGYCTDVVTERAIEFLEKERDPEKPFLLMVQHKAPHRNWMPALRHLSLYEDVEIPEPPTLFDDYEDNAPPARHQETEIDRHMGLHFDLFVDLTPDFEDPDPSRSVDRSGWENMKRMTPEQLKAWRDFYGPRDKAFHESNLEGKELVRWKFQQYAKNYLRCIKGVDESVGRLRGKLAELGLDENTLVIYSSDQGFFVGEHGWFDKRWMYEESMMMPFIAAWPGKIEAGSRSSALIQNLDYAPTFLSAAGVEVPDEMQGRSLLPLFESQGEKPADWREELYYHYYEYPSVHMVPRHYGIRTERYKLTHFYQFGDEWEFYDLQEDPDELRNLYREPSAQEAIGKVRSRLEKLREYYEDDSKVTAKSEEWQQKVRGEGVERLQKAGD
ncbi:MAG: sulfatase [Verrucomicrobiota bacterium JB023]|nr:sulfatase [Verrucomicrobiota bacterium JB023]